MIGTWCSGVCVFVGSLLLACSSATVPPPAPVAPPAPAAAPIAVPAQAAPAPTLGGRAVYEDGTPAAGALITITRTSTGKEMVVIAADRDGHFATMLDAGEYALAVTTEDGFAYVDKTAAPDLAAAITVTRTCRAVSGRVKGAKPGTQVSLVRISQLAGDVFLGNLRDDGTFSLCLPEGQYAGELRGSTLAPLFGVSLAGHAASAPGGVHVDIDGIAADVVKQPPREVVRVGATMDGLVADILARNARVVGLGEATHGTAELTTSRAELTLELIRRADVRLVLFELDAVVSSAIDDYVMGRDVDLPKAVAALGFWITDTYELLSFFEQLRAYNATARHKVHVSGVDVQNTEHPVKLLLANARMLKLTAEHEALLAAVVERRGRSVSDFTPARRAALDALLARIAKRRVSTDTDLRIAVAARSLIVQVGYMDGDIDGLYGVRRDAGMASLASYLVAQTRAPRACIWAHSAHVARETEETDGSLGTHLAAVAANRYYPIGFYVYEGSVRAWDAAGEIGVIEHPMPRATDDTLEGAVMAATGTPDIAWLPVSGFPAPLRTWAEVPRYVREVGSGVSENGMTTLRSIPTAFDAVVVIKTGHGSSPTPTGIRKADD